ncbi:MAG: alpha/beta hydrolase [Bacilli bacterium]|nr:alpha/beta hydrolase [Bacilli bacterium]
MYFKYNDITIFYKKYGNQKNTILILPGWGNTSSTFQYIINNFKNKYTIYIIDYPGFGESPIPQKELSIYDYSELIFNFIKEKNISNPIIIAHSFGGRITAILLSKYQLFSEKIVLFDVAGIKRKKTLKQFVKEKIYKLLKKSIIILPKIKRETYYQKLLLLFASPDYKNLPPSMHKTFQNIIKEDLRKYYKEIKADSLLIWGEKDLDTPLKDAYIINKLIKKSALIIYKNANHYSYLYYPEKTISILNKFI